MEHHRHEAGDASDTSGSFTRLGPEEIRRYSRHLIMPEVGVEGQERLRSARVLCVGAGGLGSPLLLYIAAAGVGTIGLVDPDTVDLTNIQRQILYRTADIDRPKTEAAAERIVTLNPHVSVVSHAVRLEVGNAAEIISGYDLVVDGTDNFATRYLINDACVLADRPNVYGSIFRFEGQVSVFDARRGPCHRCLFPTPPAPGSVPSCAEAGVLGVLPGIIGSLQALEVLKLILGIGDPLIGRLLLFDALSLRFQELSLPKDPRCPVCGESPSIDSLRAESFECAVPDSPDSKMSTDTTARDLTVADLKRLRDAGAPIELIDVREPFEHSIARIEGARLIPLGSLERQMSGWDRSLRYVIYCHTGVRSGLATSTMRAAGFGLVHNLLGGIEAWAAQIDPSVPRY